MNNLTPQEIQELLEMGIDPSSVVSAYDEADLGSFVNNTVGKLKNAFQYQPSINPAAPSQGGTAFSLAGGTGSSVFNTGAPLNVVRPNQPSQIQMTGSNAPSVSAPPQSGPTKLQNAYQKTKEFATKTEDYLKDKYQDKIKDGKSFKPFDKTMQGLMGGISYGAGMNQAAQVQQQNRETYQSPFKEAGNTKEYYNNDFIGENDPMFFLNSKVGAKAEASPMYAASGVPIEAEGGEFYLDPSTGATLPIHGPSHEKGGVKMVAEQGSYIMSDNVKIPGSFVNDMLKKNALPDKKQYTISDVIRQFPQHFDTKTDAEKLADRSLDPIARTSYEMNMKKKLANVSKLLAYQQSMNGGHGEEKGPEARYGMEINGGAPLSFDYRADELRVKDMQQMQQQQQMPTASKGNKNTTPRFKTKEEADAYYRAHAPTDPKQKELFHKELEAAMKRGADKFVFSGNKLSYEAKEDPTYNTGRMKGVGGTTLEINGRPATPEQYNAYYGIKPTSNQLLISPRGFGAIGSFENTSGRIGPDGKPIGMGQKDDYALTGGTTNPEIYNQIEKFVESTVGRDTWNKMPDELKTQMYSFAFNHGIDTPEKQQHLLSGLAQAIGQTTTPGTVSVSIGANGKPVTTYGGGDAPEGLAYRQGLSSDDALKIIKGANLSDENILNNYINVLGNQYQTLAGSMPKEYAPTLAGRAVAIHNLYGKGNASTDSETIKDEYIYPSAETQNTIRSIQNTDKAGYDKLNMEDDKFKADFKNRHPDLWEKFGMENWKAADFHDKKKVEDLQKGLNAKGFNIKVDGQFGWETYQVPGKKTNTPTFDKMELPKPEEQPIPEKEKEKPKGIPYKERLPLGQYMGLLPSPRTQNYLPEYRQERYEPNLVSLRSAKNDQTAAMNSMLQQQGMNPATMSARQASLYGEAAKNIGAITEQENNTNAQILNQAKAQNAQMATQTNAMQQAANKQYVTENAQDLAALDADRYQKLSDLYSAQQKVNQYNKTLKFLDDHAGPNYDYGVDKEGNVTLTRNDKQASFNPTTGNAQQMQQYNKMLNTNVQNTETQAPGNNATNPNTKQDATTQPTNASTTTTNRIGGAVKKRSRLII